MKPPSVAGANLQRPLLALVLVFLISLPALTLRIYATDEIQYFSYLRSLWFDRDVSFDNEYQYFVAAGPGQTSGFAETHLQQTTETGLRINFGTIGAALLWSPFYALADVWVLVTRGTRDGYSTPYVVAACLGSAFYGFAALALSMVAAIRTTGTRPWRAFAAAACVWAGTPLLFYMYLAPVFAHAVSAFAVALFVVVWLRVRESWSAAGLATLGAVAGLMVMVREQDAAYVIGPAVDFVWRHRRLTSATRARVLLATAAGIGAFVLAYAPQAAAYLALNGGVRPSRLVTRKMYWYSPHLLEVLFSPEHGYLAWTPLAALALIGLGLCIVRLWRSPNDDAEARRTLAVCLATMVAAQIYLLGAIDSWTSAGAFGQRRFVSTTVFGVIGLAALFDSVRQPRTRGLVGLAVAFSIYWNLALMALFGAGLMSRQSLDLRQNAYDAFVTLPTMAPDLAHRYFFDRRSFFRRPT